MSSIFENMPKGSQKGEELWAKFIKRIKNFLLCGRIGGIRLREESLKDGR